MANLIQLLKQLKTVIDSTEIINHVSIGIDDEVPTMKAMASPMCHIVLNGARMNGPTTVFDLDLMFLGLVDFNKESVRDQLVPWLGADNMLFNLSDLLLAAEAVYMDFERGASNRANYKLVAGAFNAKPLKNIGKDLWSGWLITMTIQVPNSNTTDGIC